MTYRIQVSHKSGHQLVQASQYLGLPVCSKIKNNEDLKYADNIEDEDNLKNKVSFKKRK